MEKLVKDLKSALNKKDIGLSGEIEIVISFGDLLWGDIPSVDEMVNDPAFIIKTQNRLMGIQRVRGEIRFYAGFVDKNSNCEEDCEIGIFSNINDTVCYVDNFINKGECFSKITVMRKPPPFLE